jgi:hypothetical protein
MAATHDVALWIDPFSHHFEQDRLFDVSLEERCGGDNILAPYTYLRGWLKDRGVRVHTADQLLRGKKRSKKNIHISFGMWDRYRKLAKERDVILSAFFAFEGPIIQPGMYRKLASVQNYVKRIYSFSDSESLKPFLRRPLALRPFRIPQSFSRVREELWSRPYRGFLVMINANRLPCVFVNELYTERVRAVEFFSRTGEIDLYGIGWDGPPYRPFRWRWPGTAQRVLRRCQHYWECVRPNPLLRAARSVWRGPTLNKGETLAKYTFSLVFDNQILKGWITEKIFDCFFCGTIPIYWGASDVQDYIPQECFIDMRRFSGYAELRTYLKSLSAREIQTYQEEARAFVESPRFHPFTKEAFAELIGSIIEEDAGIRLCSPVPV